MDMGTIEENIVLGSADNPIVRQSTKNLIEAPEKCFKTTFLARLMIGISCGRTVYQALPVPKARRVLYLHGELSKPEIQERTRAAVNDMPGPFENIFQGKHLEAHLVDTKGQDVLRGLVEQFKPDDLALDAWQSFISGCDENSFADISQATKFCDALIQDYGVTLWIPIHLGKDRKRGARGHSSIAGWRDTKISLSRSGDAVEVKTEPRWAKPPLPFRLRFRDGTLWDDTGHSGFGGQTAHIRDLVEANGGRLSREQLSELLGKDNRDATRKAIVRAEKAGAIRPVNGVYVLEPKVVG